MNGIFRIQPLSLILHKSRLKLTAFSESRLKVFRLFNMWSHFMFTESVGLCLVGRRLYVVFQKMTPANLLKIMISFNTVSSGCYAIKRYNCPENIIHSVWSAQHIIIALKVFSVRWLLPQETLLTSKLLEGAVARRWQYLNAFGHDSGMLHNRLLWRA